MRPIPVFLFRRCFSYKSCSFRCGFNPVWDTNAFSKDRKLMRPVILSPLLGKKYFDASKIFTVPGLSRHKEYRGKKLVGFTMDQMYAVVSDVDSYKSFVPFCVDSVVWEKTPSDMSGKLVIGFPPVIESYTSRVTLRKPYLVKAECTDGKVLNHLNTTWTFSPGLKSRPQSCVINFYLTFEFKSLIHSQLAHMFFNELVRQMEKAFFQEAEKRYGRPALDTVALKIDSS